MSTENKIIHLLGAGLKNLTKLKKKKAKQFARVLSRQLSNVHCALLRGGCMHSCEKSVQWCP